MEKVQKGLYIDFKEFLQENVSLLQRLQDLGQVNQPIVAGVKNAGHTGCKSLGLVLSVFLRAKTSCEETRELAAYGMIVLHLDKKHTGSGWQLYGRQFRQEEAAEAALPWSEINLILDGSHGSGALQPKVCPYCLSADHIKEEYALA